MGVVVRRYIDFLILLIPTLLVLPLFLQQYPYLFILKMFFVLVILYKRVFLVAVNTYGTIFRCLDARGGRKLRTDTHTRGTTT